MSIRIRLPAFEYERSLHAACFSTMRPRCGTSRRP